MVEHRQEFQRALEAIESKVIELFALVAGAPVPEDDLFAGLRPATLR